MGNEEMNEWYAYTHIEGGVNVKRYFDRGDIKEAGESDFVVSVVGPFKARDRAHAMEIAEGRLVS